MFALFEQASESKLDGKCDHNLPAFLETPMVLLVGFFFSVKELYQIHTSVETEVYQGCLQGGGQRFLCFSDSVYCIYMLQAGAKCVMPMENIIYFNIAQDVEKKDADGYLYAYIFYMYAYIKSACA